MRDGWRSRATSTQLLKRICWCNIGERELWNKLRKVRHRGKGHREKHNLKGMEALWCHVWRPWRWMALTWMLEFFLLEYLWRLSKADNLALLFIVWNTCLSLLDHIGDGPRFIWVLGLDWRYEDGWCEETVSVHGLLGTVHEGGRVYGEGSSCLLRLLALADEGKESEIEPELESSH